MTSTRLSTSAGVSTAAGAEFSPTVLLRCGVLTAGLYVVGVALAPLRWPGYDAGAQLISELTAIDAPTRPLVVGLLTVHGALLCAFCVGVWRSSRGRALRTSSVALMGAAVVGLVLHPFFPMHLRGADPTFTDTMHARLTFVWVVLVLVAVGSAAVAFGWRFRLYSMVTVVALAAFGALTAKATEGLDSGAPTPGAGTYERLDAAVHLLLLTVLAIALLRRQGASRKW